MKPKILLIIPNYGFGGAQRVFSDHANLLAEHYEVHECVFNLEVGQYYKTNSTVHSLDVSSGSNIIMKIIRFFQRIHRLKNIKKKLGVTYSISHLEGADYINIFSRSNEKNICVIHGSKRADENIRGVIGFIRHRILMPFVYKNTNQIVTVSQGIKKELEDFYKINSSKIIAIPNFFDVDLIQKKSFEKCDDRIVELNKEFKTILFSGRFAFQKNLFSLIEIFCVLKKHRTDVKLIMAGDGELKNQLFKKCHDYKLSLTESYDKKADVVFIGYQENPFPIIKNTDLFIMTSKWEGFPMALCEAIAVGAKVVASDCPTGPKEIIDGMNNEFHQLKIGHLLPIPLENESKSIDIWVKALNKILNESLDNDLMKTNRMKYIRKYDKSEVAKQWLFILN